MNILSELIFVIFLNEISCLLLKKYFLEIDNYEVLGYCKVKQNLKGRIYKK